MTSISTAQKYRKSFIEYFPIFGLCKGIYLTCQYLFCSIFVKKLSHCKSVWQCAFINLQCVSNQLCPLLLTERWCAMHRKNDNDWPIHSFMLSFHDLHHPSLRHLPPQCATRSYCVLATYRVGRHGWTTITCDIVYNKTFLTPVLVCLFMWHIVGPGHDLKQLSDFCRGTNDL